MNIYQNMVVMIMHIHPMNNTNYYFDIMPDGFKEGLDRFAQFFINPLFDQSATDQLNAVHNEHCKNLQSDPRRLLQLIKNTLSNKSHPFAQFSTGNKDTLDIDNIRQNY